LRDRSSSVTAPDFWMSAWLWALIENGTSRIVASRLVAVTMISSTTSVRSWAEATAGGTTSAASEVAASSACRAPRR
jgi:hypothetical protein